MASALAYALAAAEAASTPDEECVSLAGFLAAVEEALAPAIDADAATEPIALASFAPEPEAPPLEGSLDKLSQTVHEPLQQQPLPPAALEVQERDDMRAVRTVPPAAKTIMSASKQNLMAWAQIAVAEGSDNDSSIDDTCSTHASASEIGKDEVDEHIRHDEDFFDRCVSDGVEELLPQDPLPEQQEQQQPAPEQRGGDQSGTARPGGCSEEAAERSRPAPELPLPAPEEPEQQNPAVEESEQQKPEVEARREEVASQPCEKAGREEVASQPCEKARREEVAPQPCEKADAGCSQEQLPRAACKIVEQSLAPLKALPLQLRCKQQPPDASKLSAGLRVAIVVNGSLGDVQPMVALAQQLRMFRHTIRFMVSANHVPVCKSNFMDVVPVFADSQAVINNIGGLEESMEKGTSRGGEAAKVWLAEHSSVCIPVMDALADFKPEAIVCSVQAFGPCFQYETLAKVPVLPVFLSHDAYWVWNTFANVKPARPAFNTSSPYLEPRLMEKASAIHRTGEWALYKVPRQQDLTDGPLAALRRFLGTGPVPVAVGWGSMVPKGMKPAGMLVLALRALKGAQRRGVILGGYAELDKLAGSLADGSLEGLGDDAAELAAFAATEVCLVGSAPHEWLFPQCRVVVHHGGVGTWHAAGRAGKPSVITPIFADQFSHAVVAEKSNIGVGFKKTLQKIKASELSSAILRAETKADAAEAVGRKMRSQVGEREAAAIMDAFMRDQVRTGKWVQEKLKGAQKLRIACHKAKLPVMPAPAAAHFR